MNHRCWSGWRISAGKQIDRKEKVGRERAVLDAALIDFTIHHNGYDHGGVLGRVITKDQDI